MPAAPSQGRRATLPGLCINAAIAVVALLLAAPRVLHDPRVPPDALDAVALRGRLVVLTGGPAGIGLETARRLVGRGASVVLTSRDGDRAAAAAASLGGGAVGLALDLADLDDVRRFAEELATRLDGGGDGGGAEGVAATPLGALVLNAGMVYGPEFLGRVTTHLNHRLCSSGEGIKSETYFRRWEIDRGRVARVGPGARLRPPSPPSPRSTRYEVLAGLRHTHTRARAHPSRGSLPW